MKFRFQHDRIVLSLMLFAGLMVAVFARWPGRQPVVAPTHFVLPVSGQAPERTILTFTLDRSGLPPLNYRDVTLKIQLGAAEQVSASAGGQALPVRYDPASGVATITTAADILTVSFLPAASTETVVSYELAALKEDRAWAWSHSFDDNKGFEKRGVPAFDRYGWRGTVYIIGKELNDTRQEDWIMDRPDLIDLLRKGWGLGNHTWNHQTVAGIGGPDAARRDILALADYLRGVAGEAGRPDYTPVAFAAPNFDAPYHPVLLGLRDSGASGLLFNESGGNGFMRVDAGISVADERFTVFDPDEPVGRDWRIDRMGSGDEFDQTFQADLNAMLAALENGQHYWLNTFTHDVDDRPENQSIFAFLPWLYNTHGPGGENTVWVAPAEEIYAYLLVRDGVKISVSTGQQPVEPDPTPTPTSTPLVPSTPRLYLPMIWIRSGW